MMRSPVERNRPAVGTHALAHSQMQDELKGSCGLSSIFFFFFQVQTEKSEHQNSASRDQQ